MAKKDSPYRTATIDENLRLWKEMQKGSEEGLKCCVRAKIDMQSNNGALRDPATFRCNLTPHHQTKDKYKVYPTYDLACPIVDALEGVTHALRDRQYSDRDAQYEWFLTNLKLRKVHLWGFSRINFVRRSSRSGSCSGSSTRGSPTAGTTRASRPSRGSSAAG